MLLSTIDILSDQFSARLVLVVQAAAVLLSTLC